MAVLFDIDGTLTNFEKFVLDNGPKYMLNKHGIAVANKDGYDIDQVFALTKYFLKEGMDYDKAVKTGDKIMSQFWQRYYLKYIRTPFREGAADLITKLQEEGNDVAFVSSRKHSTEKTLMGRFVKASIDWQFKHNDVQNANIMLFENDLEKTIYLFNESHNGHVLIDDKPELILDMSESMPTFCIESAYNRNNYLGREVESFDNYTDGRLYEAIKERQKIKTKVKTYDRSKGALYNG